MKRRSKGKILIGDFETTVYEGQTSTEVWASAVVELYTENVQIHHSIDETFDYLKKLDSNVTIYYHNLKFDGSFWIDYLLNTLNFKQAYHHLDDSDDHLEWDKDWLMPSNSFKYSISDKGQWYTILIRVAGHYIEIRDSLKLLPFSVARIGKSFKTKHQKLEMEYKGYRYAGCEITLEEKKYIANDVLVVKEAMEIMYNKGLDKLTIGACCLSEYKEICKLSLKNMLTYDEMYPDLTAITIDSNTHKYHNADEWLRRSYKGGWCYVVKGKECKTFYNGTTADVNSLYPSVMHSQSGSRYPIGKPKFWSGNIIPNEALGDDRYFFIRVKTRFYIKENYLPFIQIKNNSHYLGTEALETSDIKHPRTGEYFTHYTDKDGNLHDTRVELTLTMTDYYLMLEHYELVDFEILDGCWFYSQIGIFDEYIDKWAKIKKESTGAIREQSKLFLNNLYGKMASSTDSSFKVAYQKPDTVVGFNTILEHNKKAGFIAVGSAITSYARNFTIRVAQMNYHGKNERGFIYADTDSIHCDLLPEEIVGIKVHDKDFCCWKLESCWDVGYFTRQKTYIEHITHENLNQIESPYYNIKCAGMPDRCKKLFDLSLQGKQEYDESMPQEVKDFLFDKDGNKIIRTLDDFKQGLKVPCKLRPKRIKGGIVLEDTTYEMR